MVRPNKNRMFNISTLLWGSPVMEVKEVGNMTRRWFRRCHRVP